jgi:uncharacterized protein
MQQEHAVRSDWLEAARRGSVEELQRLSATGIDIDTRDRHGQTALMLAAAEGYSQVVDWLIERGAALDNTAKYGLSALMLAVIRGHVDVVRKLIDGGAGLGLRGTGAPGFANKTASDLAIDRGDPEMLELLQLDGDWGRP